MIGGQFVRAHQWLYRISELPLNGRELILRDSIAWIIEPAGAQGRLTLSNGRLTFRSMALRLVTDQLFVEIPVDTWWDAEVVRPSLKRVHFPGMPAFRVRSSVGEFVFQTLDASDWARQISGLVSQARTSRQDTEEANPQ